MALSLRQAVGRSIRELRLSKKISQEELANRAGVERSYMSLIEQGKANITIVTAEQIARVLDVEVKDFFP
jgi:transcriptional regulator with XRE-family HTH domain